MVKTRNEEMEHEETRWI